MDLALYFRVLWRFKVLVAAGLVLALGLTLLTIAQVSFANGLTSPSFKYREQEVWTSGSTVLLTQPGFPWGRSVFPVRPMPAPEELKEPYVPKYADPGRFYSLAELYAHLVNGDEVRAFARRDGPLDGTFSAVPVVARSGSGQLPLITLTGFSSSPRKAVEITRRATNAFRDYIAAQQQQASIPRNQRVHVEVVAEAQRAELFEGRRKTLPAVVFLTVMMAVIGLAFLLENLRPRVGTIETIDRLPAAESRRSA